MSVLLRQADGFESFGPLLVEPVFNDASLAKGPNQNASRFDLDSVPAPEVCSVRHHDVLAALDDSSGDTVTRSNISSQVFQKARDASYPR